MLLIPPAGASRMIWLSGQVPVLRRAGYRVVAVDLPGTGSGPLGGEQFRLDDAVAGITGLMADESMEQCHLIGASLGGLVALELALRGDGLARSLTLLGTRVRTDFFRREIAGCWADRARDPRPPSAHDAVARMTQLLSPATLADERAAADWLAVFTRFLPSGAGVASQHEVSAGAFDRRPALPGITAPCLVIAFSDDLISPPAMCREVADLIPAARFAEIPGTGHLGFAERPDDVNALILSFLSRHPMPAGSGVAR